MGASKEQIEVVKGNMAKCGIEFLRIENCEIKRPLSEEELADIAEEITEHVLKAKEYEDEKKAEGKRLKDLQDKEDAQAQALSTLYQDKATKVDEDCLIGYDPNRKVISIVDPVTGREVAFRTPKPEDFQTTMNIDPKAATAHQEPKAPNQAPEALALGFDGGKGDHGPIEVDGVVIDGDDLTAGLEEGVKDAEETKETKTVTTQVGSISESSGAMFAETPDGTFYSTNPEIHEILKTAVDSRVYVEIAYRGSDTRNQEIVSVTPRPVEEPSVDLEMPDGVVDASEDLD